MKTSHKRFNHGPVSGPPCEPKRSAFDELAPDDQQYVLNRHNSRYEAILGAHEFSLEPVEEVLIARRAPAPVAVVLMSNALPLKLGHGCS